MIILKNESIWNEIDINEFPKLNENIKTSVLVIGGGITGILCAYELKKRNIDAVLVEQNRIGRGITKNTTAFITAQHEMLYQDIVDNFSLEEAREYLKLNLKAVEEFKNLGIKYDIDYKECSSTLFTSNNEEIIIKEKKVLDELGYDTEIINELPLEEIDIKIGLRFNNQGSINPLKCIKELSKELKIYEHTRIEKLKGNVAYTLNNKIEFDKVIIATHYPFINYTGMYYVKLRQKRSYMVAFKHKPIEGTYCSVDDGMYFRGYNDYLIIGGNDRETKCECTSDFINKIKDTFKIDNIDYKWNNQDIVTLDEVPYIGKYGLIHNNWYVATGFNMWGFSWAMASSFILADMIEGKIEETFLNPNRWFLNKQLFINLGNTLINMVNLKKPRCTHLGVALKRNKVDRTWECPAHGSRFDELGNVINDPAKKNSNSKSFK